jgi:hypothetical protein
MPHPIRARLAALPRPPMEARGLTVIAFDAGPDAMQSFPVCARK